MGRRIPLLNLRHGFVCAARHASFTLAADELCVTQGAISRQVRILEQTLGVALFERGHRSVRLTRAGKDYYDALKPGFEQIETATGRLLVNRSRQTLVVRAYSTFATRWLIPRLARFYRMYPKIFVDFTASIRPVDFEREDVDIAVHFGLARELPHLNQSLLFPLNIVPVCSPALVRSAWPLRHPSDLTRRQAIDEMIDWLTFYNRRRLHFTRGYISSKQCENSWLAAQVKRAILLDRLRTSEYRGEVRLPSTSNGARRHGARAHTCQTARLRGWA